VLEVACKDAELMATQAAASRSVGHIDATKKLADLAEALIAGKTIEEFKKGETS